MICVDASVAAKWVLSEPDSPRARALYRAAIDSGDRIVAPPLLPIEIANILRQRMRRTGLTLPSARRRLERFLLYPITLSVPPGLYEQALELAATHNLSAVYDAHYVSLAQLLGCNFWTADQRLFNTLNPGLPFVKWSGNYQQGDPITA